MAGPSSSRGTPTALPPLEGSKRWITALSLAVVTFMQVLDSTIANVSLPTISGNLGTSTDQGTWMITGFAAANGIGVPLTGWLMGRYGVVHTFVFAVLGFTIASFMCGIAWSLPVLILFRVLQGMLSGPMIPGSQALLMGIFPQRQRPLALGIWSMTTLVAPVAGPILGGWISDNYYWGWIFLINVPLGLGAATLCWINLRDRETPTRKLPIDTVGLVLLVVWVGALQTLLDKGKDLDWFQSALINGLAVIAILAFITWIIWELTEEHPVVDLSLFTGRNFAFGTFAFCLMYAVFMGNTLILPLWLQSNVAYTATWAGLVAAPSGGVAIAATLFMAKFLARVDTRITASVAFVTFAVSSFMRSGLVQNGTFWDFAIPSLVQGISIGLFFVSLITIVLDGIPPPRIPAATGLSNFTRITGGSFAISFSTVLWDRREALHQSRLSDFSTLYNPAMRDAVTQLHDHGVTGAKAYGVLTNGLVQQAYLLSSNDIFWLSGWLALLCIPLVWLARRSISGGGPVAAD
jgi:DHA2 family multidrug resistance protein